MRAEIRRPQKNPRQITLTGAFYNMVRTERLELSHLAALEPKSSVSTNSTTTAMLYVLKNHMSLKAVRIMQ